MRCKIRKDKKRRSVHLFLTGMLFQAVFLCLFYNLVEHNFSSLAFYDTMIYKLIFLSLSDDTMFCKIISITNQKEKRSYPDKKRLKSIKFYSFQSIFIRDKVKKFILEMGKLLYKMMPEKIKEFNR